MGLSLCLSLRQWRAIGRRSWSGATFSRSLSLRSNSGMGIIFIPVGQEDSLRIRWCWEAVSDGLDDNNTQGEDVQFVSAAGLGTQSLGRHGNRCTWTLSELTVVHTRVSISHLRHSKSVTLPGSSSRKKMVCRIFAAQGRWSSVALPHNHRSQSPRPQKCEQRHFGSQTHHEDSQLVSGPFVQLNWRKMQERWKSVFECNCTNLCISLKTRK